MLIEYKKKFDKVLKELIYKFRYSSNPLKKMSEIINEKIKTDQDNLEEEKKEIVEEIDTKLKNIKKRFQYANENKNLLENFVSCNVCLKEKKEIKIFGLTNCLHLYCSECLIQTYEKNYPCPLCRNELNDEDDIYFFHIDDVDHEMYINVEYEDPLYKNNFLLFNNENGTLPLNDLILVTDDENINFDNFVTSLNSFNETENVIAELNDKILVLENNLNNERSRNEDLNRKILKLKQENIKHYDEKISLLTNLLKNNKRLQEEKIKYLNKNIESAHKEMKIIELKIENLKLRSKIKILMDKI